MKKILVIVANLIVICASGAAHAEDGCVIKNVKDESCESGHRLYSSLDPKLNVCADSSRNSIKISGLYCRSVHACFRDSRSEYNDRDSNFAWYNCYLGAGPIPETRDGSPESESFQYGCVIKEINDESCESGRRLYSKQDARLTECAEVGDDSSEVAGAYCKSRFRCFKDFSSMYRDGDTIFAWYNCYPGAIIIPTR